MGSGSKSEPSPIAGDYQEDGTNIFTSTHDPSGACAGLYAPHRSQQTVQISQVEDTSDFLIKSVEEGESFKAHLVASDRLEAENATVVIDASGGASQFQGVKSATVLNMRWNVAAGVYQKVVTLVKDLPGMEGPACGFIDSRIVGVNDPIYHWVKYEAAANFPVDSPHGGECVIGGGSYPYGYLGLAYGTSRNDLNIYVQGVGCTFIAHSTDGVLFTANSADCPLDPVFSVARLGIVTWSFENFSLDMGAMQLSFLARATRKSDTGELLDLCLRLDSAVTGDLPL